MKWREQKIESKTKGPAGGAAQFGQVTYMSLYKIRYPPPNGRTRESELGPVQVRSSGKRCFLAQISCRFVKKSTFFGVPICTWGGFQND